MLITTSLISSPSSLRSSFIKFALLLFQLHVQFQSEKHSFFRFMDFSKFEDEPKVHCFPGLRCSYRDCSETGMITAITKCQIISNSQVLAQTKEMLSRSHPLQRHCHQLIVAGEWKIIPPPLLPLLLFKLQSLCSSGWTHIHIHMGITNWTL